MKIRLSNQEYKLDDSWMTTLRYRARYGVSFLYENISDTIALAQLCYVGIIGDKPDEEAFLREALADSLFLRAAAAFRARVYRPDTSADGIKGSQTPESEQTDELYTAAAWAHCHLPECLLSELSTSQVAGLIHIHGQMASGNTKPHQMEAEEQAGVYGISAAAERRVLEFLKNQEAGNGAE